MVVGTKEPTANAQRMWSSHLRWALLFYHNSYYMNSNKNERHAPAINERQKVLKKLHLSGNNSTQQATAHALPRKKNIFKFCDCKNNLYLCDAIHTQRRRSPQKSVGYFYAHSQIQRFHAPVSLVNAATAFEVYGNGSVWNRFLFFCTTNFLISHAIH